MSMAHTRLKIAMMAQRTITLPLMGPCQLWSAKPASRETLNERRDPSPRDTQPGSQTPLECTAHSRISQVIASFAAGLVPSGVLGSQNSHQIKTQLACD